jgi:tetratricopeptide (TPR) repeat protein
MRLASLGGDEAVKVWDAASGLELRTLKEHTDSAYGVPFMHGGTVAFSPDGTRIASAGYDRTVKIWDASPLTEDVRAEREALGLLEFLFSKGLVKAQVLENLRGNRTISEPVRQKALVLTEPYSKSVVHQQAVRLVEPLFAKAMLKFDVIESVRNNHALREELRQEAIALAESWRQDPNVLNGASWAIVSEPGADASAYRLALRQAEEACRLASGNGLYLNTLGVAQYRLGHYEQALETLLRSEKLNSVGFQGSHPADLAFLAMTYHQLGQKGPAEEMLERLRETRKKPQWAGDVEAPAFLSEAEALLQAHTDKP